MRWVVAAWAILAVAEWGLRHALVATGWGVALLHAGGDPHALAPGLALVALRLAVIGTAPLVAAASWLRLVAHPRGGDAIPSLSRPQHTSASKRSIAQA